MFCVTEPRSKQNKKLLSTNAMRGLQVTDVANKGLLGFLTAPTGRKL